MNFATYASWMVVGLCSSLHFGLLLNFYRIRRAKDDTVYSIDAGLGYAKGVTPIFDFPQTGSPGETVLWDFRFLVASK